MSHLNIKQLEIEQAKSKEFNFLIYEVTLKRDGTLIYFKEGKLFSPRCERSERFKHILQILKENNFLDCYGEMYFENGNVFDVSRKENWDKVKFMPIALINSGIDFKGEQKYITDKIKEINNPFITEMIKFNDINEGWDYVIKNESEGLVLRNNCNWFKVKMLKEAKIEIESHEKGKEKGTFILINGNRVSGTSKEFIRQFEEIKAKGEKPIMELEYPFLTKNGKYFQPRCRRIYI